ncbi:cytochrome P450 [Streptomyces fumigatiscleroticus]|nr:cytochrome P450 [Streptomyces fumigatiscleroticus]
MTRSASADDEHGGTPEPASGAARSTVPPLVSGALPVVGHLPAFLRDATGVLGRGHHEHGHAFRLALAGVQAVVLLAPGDRDDLTSRPEEELSIGTSYSFLRSMFGKNFYFVAELSEYRRQRDLFAPLFRSTALRAYLRTMERHARQLIDSLGRQGEFELNRLCAELNLAIIADSFFGDEFGPRFAHSLKPFERFSDNISLLLPPPLRPVHYLRSRSARRRLEGLVHQCLTERRSRPVTTPDLLQSLCDSRYPDGTPVPDHEAVHQALGLVWAARETTSGQFAWALADLLRHPEHHPALLAEQERHLSPDAPLSLEGLHRLTHMDHVLYESERLNPLTILIARKTARHTAIGGHRLRRGTLVLTSPYLTHRLPEEFPEPHAFRPERYAEDPTAAQRLLGFGAGIHRCLGQRFSRLEIKTCLTLLLRRYEMDLVDQPVAVARLAPRTIAAPCRVRYRLRGTG